MADPVDLPTDRYEALTGVPKPEAAEVLARCERATIAGDKHFRDAFSVVVAAFVVALALVIAGIHYAVKGPFWIGGLLILTSPVLMGVGIRRSDQHAFKGKQVVADYLNGYKP